MEKEPRLDNITVQSVVDTERVGYESTERPIIEEALGIKFYPGYLERHGLDPIFVNDELVHSAFPGISDVKLKSAIDLVHMMGTFLTGHTYIATSWVITMSYVKECLRSGRCCMVLIL